MEKHRTGFQRGPVMTIPKIEFCQEVNKACIEHPKIFRASSIISIIPVVSSRERSSETQHGLEGRTANLRRLALQERQQRQYIDQKAQHFVNVPIVWQPSYFLRYNEAATPTATMPPRTEQHFIKHRCTAIPIITWNRSPKASCSLAKGKS